MPQKPLVAVLYSNKDEKIAAQILDQLKTGGILDLWTRDSMVPGARWQEEITRKLNSAARVVFLVSASALADDALVEYLEKVKGRGDRFLKPILASSCMYEYEPSLKGVKVYVPKKDDKDFTNFARQVIEEALAEPPVAQAQPELLPQKYAQPPGDPGPGIEELKQRFARRHGGGINASEENQQKEPASGIEALRARRRQKPEPRF